MPLIPSKKVFEGNSCVLEFTLTDIDGVTGVGAGNIATATMKLTNKATAAVINSRTAVNVISYINGSGFFQMVLDPADNPIVDSTLTEEVHIALFTFTYTLSARTMTLKQEVYITVQNIQST